MDARIGELAALATALFWAVTALAFESAGRRIGSVTVNILRLLMATVLFIGYGLIARGMAIPMDVSLAGWGWLALSGLVGFVIGDLMLFQAFVDIGARISMLIYASVPPLTGLLGWIILGERLGPIELGGMGLTVTGIALVVLRRSSAGSQEPHRHQIRGILLAFGGALGQAGGLILGRIGAGVSVDPFAATQIRAFAGIVGFALVFTVTRRWRDILRAVSDRVAMLRVGIGALFGPFLGVSLGLYAAQRTSVGVASTIMALVPVIIIVPAALVFKEKIRRHEVIGALIAVAGVAVLFL